MARLIRLAVAALSALGLSTTAGSALADAAGRAAPPFVGCQVAIGANGTSLPSNAPALLVSDASNQATATISAELVSADERLPFGAPTQDTHGLLIVALPTAAVGSYTVATKVVCSTGTGSPESSQETSLTLTAPIDLPTTVGTLAVRPTPTPTAVTRVALEASPGLRAFKSIAVVQLSVNGVVTMRSNSGGFAEELNVNTGTVCVEDGALHREKRTVRVSLSAQLAGLAESPAPALLDLEVDCGAIRWTTDADFDGATSKTPSTSEPEPDSSDEGTRASSVSSCSAAPNGLMSERSAVFAAATALALLASFRRRRAASTR